MRVRALRAARVGDPFCCSGGLVASRVEGMNDAMRGCAQVAGASGGGQAN